MVWLPAFSYVRLLLMCYAPPTDPFAGCSFRRRTASCVPASPQRARARHKARAAASSGD
ncbi:hypothetical protein MESS4_p20095 [Mesorhizobium sp. STM 4661]|nr:hypothetical protein MESS4_p20095 [Mesorhizobium sp. STM 4661]